MTTSTALCVATLLFALVLLLREVWPRMAGREPLLAMACVGASAIYRLFAFGEPWMFISCVAGILIGWPLARWMKSWV